MNLKQKFEHLTTHTSNSMPGGRADVNFGRFQRQARFAFLTEQCAHASTH